jgi:transcriptional regulator of acetoin/glycerol metabolism
MTTLAKLGGGSRPHADLVLRIAGGAIARDAAETTSTVGVSWRRCLNDFKLDPARDYRTVVHDVGRLKDLEYEHAELVQIARAEMDALYDHISGSGYALLLADTSGVILSEKVDPTLKSMFRHAGLIVGAEWSEEREGTNGIGTCAREARPITIHQTDHFRTRHTNLSCSAAPIHDHDGRVVAVLDASCVSATGSRETQLHTMALVHASARLIEKCLFLRRHSGNALLRFHHRPEFVDLLHDGAIAVDAAGVVVAADVTGLKLLGATTRAEVIGRSIADIFDATFEELLSAKNATRRPIWQLRDNARGRLYYASLVVGSEREDSPATVHNERGRALVQVAREEPVGALTLEDLAGDDPQMKHNLRNAQRIADHGVAVLIRGPTGSGKEAFAKALHLASNRRASAFVAVNCAAIPESLIESELFGYCAGAFTGARRAGLRGRIVQATGGTLFLDEIGDMPLGLQTRLLRVLEEHEVTPLGAGASLKVDLRVICASHRNLRELMQQGRFRDDLYYRLNGITIELPSLAARQDRSALIRKCIARECGSASLAAGAIESGALRCLMDYHWPGNIRELRTAIRTALAICDGGVIRCGDLPAEVRHCGTGGSQHHEPGPASFASAERGVLLQVIERHNWVMSRVAVELRISRNTLYRKIKAHGIQIVRAPADSAR